MKRILLFLLAIALMAPTAASAKRSKFAGTVAAYDAGSGELTLETRSGREITALVTDDTRIRGEDDDDDCDDSASLSRRGGDDDDDDDDREDDDRSRDDDEDEDDCDESGDDGIDVGDTVRKARIEFEDGEAVWKKLRLDD